MSNYKPLSYQDFSKRYWKRFSNYNHASAYAYVTVTAPEAVQLAAELPLYFLNTTKGVEFIALTGLKPAQCALIDKNGQWRARTVPGLFRIAPFRLLPMNGSQPDQKVLGVDLDSELITEPTDLPLPPDHEYFFKPGTKQPSEAVQQVISFLQILEKHNAKTQRAVQMLFDMKLLERVSHERLAEIPGLMSVNEKRFNELDDDSFIKLRQCGALAIAYIHLISMNQLSRLIEWADDQVSSVPEIMDIDALFKGMNDDLIRF